jgi:hypothetical protein
MKSCQSALATCNVALPVMFVAGKDSVSLLLPLHFENWERYSRVSIHRLWTLKKIVEHRCLPSLRGYAAFVSLVQYEGQR